MSTWADDGECPARWPGFRDCCTAHWLNAITTKCLAMNVIHWPDLDEDMELLRLLEGGKSVESERSISSLR